MGDRGNIKVVSGEKEIYFYSHWSGSELPIILRESLKRGKDRWGDYSYLNRIIFCDMISADPMGLSGFGICFQEDDNSHPHTIVDHVKETVTIQDTTWGFGEYIYICDKEINEVYFKDEDEED